MRDFAPEFKKYVAELESLLELRGCTYKVFRVSATGVLKDQNSPKLNPHNVKDPFIWFLDEIAGRKTKKMLKETLKKFLKTWRLSMRENGCKWLQRKEMPRQ